MKENKTSTLSNALIWFGAGVSIAEILTGTLIAPLGMTKGLTAIIIGHLIGCILLFFAGIIGGLTGKSSMETVKMSFGNKGSLLFAILNILQLIGWTAVMIINGAAATNSIININTEFWCIVIGILILIWILIGIKNLEKINKIAMATLFLLTIILSFIIFRNATALPVNGDIGFIAAIELSVSMPVSWLPLISDYTRSAEKPVKATVISTITYFFVSVWMYAIGMGMTLFTGESDISFILIKAGLGIAGLIIIIFSTVTTTFLDVYSAGVSAESIWIKFKEKSMAVLVCIIGVLLAVLVPITKYESFLYIISSVFTPMIAIQLTTYFILKIDYSKKYVCFANIFVWLSGFIVYHLFMNMNIAVGYTLPSMIITSILCFVVNKIFNKPGKDKLKIS